MSSKFARFVSASMAFGVAVALWLPGCNIPIPGFAAIKTTQQFDQPNFTVQFELTGINTASVSSVNWVFGDSAGFVPGGVTTTHRYNGGGNFNITAFVFFSGGGNQTVTGTANVVVPDIATNPNPANGATNIAVSTSLNWFPGKDATLSGVYLGTSSAAVNAATEASPEFLGSVGGTTFQPSNLLGATVYFWRIDSIKAGGATTKGAVWSFTTTAPPGPVSNPSPADNATGVEVDSQVTWTAGSGASSHNVYFGTDLFSVQNATPQNPLGVFRGNQFTTTFNPGALTPATTYFWRIDELGLGGTTTGSVFTFTTAPLPGQVSNPSPADTATDVPIDTALSWDAGSDATSHDVYFGTSQTAVNNANTSSPEFKGNQATTTTQPAGDNKLATNQTFFWRIDEVGPGGVTKGVVFSFVTAAAPGLTTQPSPDDGDAGVDLNPTLTWAAGSGQNDGPTDTFDVYFGTSESAVEDATTASPEFKGNQANADFAPSGPLDENTEYFWRIDAKGPGGTTKGDVWSFTSFNSLAAANPTPANDATDVPLNQSFSWSSGTCGGTLTHDVFLGKDKEAVTNATTSTPDIFQGNFPTPVFSPPSDLESGVTYFWRVDEVCDATTTKGVIWTFTTVLLPPEQVTNESPTNFATDAALNAVLSWTAGTRATSHDVYFGTDQTAVTNATPNDPQGVYRGNRPTTSYNPGALTLSTTYYWRIDEKNSAGTTTGLVFTFTTISGPPGQATNPTPGNLATGQNVNTTGYSTEIGLSLTWTAGAGTSSHDVYFGTSQANVTNATVNNPLGVFKGNQSDTTFDPGQLLPGTQYFWRIDEKNGGGTTKGVVWNFTTFTPAPGFISNPIPANATTTPDVTPTLQWSGSSNTTFYDVYFGLSQASVQNATRDSGDYIGVQASGDTDFAPGTLSAATTYFWRIDSIGPGGVTKGVVRQFNTP